MIARSRPFAASAAALSVVALSTLTVACAPGATRPRAGSASGTAAPAAADCDTVATCYTPRQLAAATKPIHGQVTLTGQFVAEPLGFGKPFLRAAQVS